MQGILMSIIILVLQAKPMVVNKVSSDEVILGSKETPHEINYQGWLGSATDTTGITDTPGMIFRLYNTSTGGSAIWSETHMAVPVDKGIFNVLLGSETSLPLSIFTGNALWLEVQVKNDTLIPRQKLVSVGYAIKSELSDNATYADTANYAKDSDKLDGQEASAFAVTGHIHSHVDSATHADTATTLQGKDTTALDNRYVNEEQLDAITSGMIVNGTILFEDIAQNGAVAGQIMKRNLANTAWIAAEDDAGDGDNNWTISGSDMYSAVSGNVGIGTSSPGAKLHISSTAGDIDKGIDVDMWDNTTNYAMRLRNNSNNIAWFGNDGNVGIGTTSPAQKLDVVTNLGSVHAQVKTNQAGQVAGVGIVNPGRSWYLQVRGELAGNPFVIRDGTAGDYRLTINSSGNVGIGTTSPSHLLDVGTSGAYCNGGAWVEGSSKEYKENITELTLDEAANAVKKLVPVMYNYKANTDEKYVGFVAEDVPELVAMKDRKGLSPMDIVAVLTKVVQEQQNEIDKLKSEIEQLKVR